MAFCNCSSQPRDFLRRGAAGQGLAQRLFRGAEVAFRPRHIAVLDPKGHFPKKIGDGDKICVISRAPQTGVDIAQAEIDPEIGREKFRSHHQGVDPGENPIPPGGNPAR